MFWDLLPSDANIVDHSGDRSLTTNVVFRRSSVPSPDHACSILHGL